jgi:DNA-binding beta-propeller fold protein YncE
MIRKIKRITPILAAVSVIAGSCEKQPVDVGGGNPVFGQGVFIVNEGQFLSANASISFYDPRTDSLQHQVFYRANGAPLGDVAHSMFIHGGDAYIVVNNSGKVYRAGLSDMVFRSKITGLTSPRYIQVAGPAPGKAYISDLYSGKIMIADPLEGRILDSIDIRHAGGRLSSEEMVIHGGRLYAACWSYGNQILVIDIATDRIIDSIQVGKQPNSMVTDSGGYLWVLSDGGYPYSPYGQEKASLSRINLATHEAETMKTWSDIRVSPTDLCINDRGDSLYFIGEGVYKISLSMDGFDTPLIRENGRQFYSLGVDPGDGTLYAGDAVDYQQDGWVYRFRPNGMPIDSFRVGVNPGHFCFTVRKQQ